MKKHLLTTIALAFTCTTFAQSDQELNRDAITGWEYLSNPVNPKSSYKPIKSQYDNGTYSVWQQQASDMLTAWIQQSYLPRGLVMRTLAKNDQRWYITTNGPLHNYGINYLGYTAHFVNGKIDLKCCEQGQRLVAGFNSFPGVFIKGFNPGGLYFFAEQAQFSGGEDDARLSAEGVDKRIQPNVYNYRTYLDHYHNGLAFNKVGVVVPKNGEWPFKPVLVKDAVDYINQQLATYPDILKKNPYSVKEIQTALENLKPYYNDVAKLSANINYENAVNDGNGHYLLDPRSFINAKRPDKTFPEYNILVSTTQQTINQSNTDKPLWLYMNLTPITDFIGTVAKFDTKFGTAEQHMVYELLNNFNFDYVSKWLSDPEKMKAVAYTPLKAAAKSSGNTTTVPVTVSATASSKNKEPNTILFEDFDGYPAGTFSAKNWHTYGHNGHDFANANLSSISGQSGKWVSIPDAFTFYPDYAPALPANFTVNYDIYFDKNVSNKRSLMYFRMDADDPKKRIPIDLHDMNREGFQFAIAMSGETETSKRFMSVKYDETLGNKKLNAFKVDDVAHISISVNGAAIVVTVNGNELMRDDNALPAGKTFKRYGWYCGVNGIYLSNIYVKSATAVNKAANTNVATEKKKTTSTPDVPTFETKEYERKDLAKLSALRPIVYPTGFKSQLPALPVSNHTAITPSKSEYTFPTQSPLLNSLPKTILSANDFKKFINDLATIVTTKLQKTNTDKIDSYLKSKKINSSLAINNNAIGMWIANKPTVALYLFCKAMQADYNDMSTANNMAALLNAYGYSEKAIPVLQYINSKASGSPSVLSNMATAFYNLGDMNSTLDFAEQSIAKDSLSADGNKVAAFVHLNKAAQAGNKAETEKAIGCLKQALKSHYDKEASDILNKIESSHNKNGDYTNTNFQEFPMLKRTQLPVMPESLEQIMSFNKLIEAERSAINKTRDEIQAARKKIPEVSAQQRIKNVSIYAASVFLTKAVTLTNESAAWYNKMKTDLQDIFKATLKDLSANHNKKVSAILKPYNDKLGKLEGGEGNGDEEEEIERLKKARCEAFNKEQSSYLSAVASLTNQFAQQSEYVSRTYWRDYANWQPFAFGDNTMAPFLQAQNGYLMDIDKILSNFIIIEPCIYPPDGSSKDNTPSKPKQWEEQYCSNFKGFIGLGAAKITFNCNSMSVSGGEGVVGEMTLTYNENGTFKEMTLGAGAGAELHYGNQNIASLSAGVSAMDYITIGNGSNGMQVNDWGFTAGVSAGANVGAVGGEANIISGTMSASEGVKVGGTVTDGLKILSR